VIITAFGIGCGDETMATVVSSGSIKLKTTLIIGAGLSIVGVLFLSDSVGKTVGSGLIGNGISYSQIMMLAVIVSTCFWVVLSSWKGVPISTTHTVVGSVIGVCISEAVISGVSIIHAVSWIKLTDVLLGWVLSPTLGFFGAYIIQKMLSEFILKKMNGLEELETKEKRFMWILIISVFITQISRSGNDSANALGILYGLSENNQISSDIVSPILVLSAIALAFGLYIVGRKVIISVGAMVSELRPSDALSIQMSTSIIMFLATILGLPISGGHVLVFAIIGAGKCRGESPDRKSFRRMIFVWLITVPVAAFMSAGIYLFLNSIMV
jgi:PiT family inorganic phosphate transporter